MIAVSTFATKRYTYCLPNWGRRLSAALAETDEEGVVIFVGDRSQEIEEASAEYVMSVLPPNWDFHLIQLDLKDEGLKNYKKDAQLLIAQMQGAAMTEARKMGADYFWSVEADVLVPSNALRTSKQVLEFDDGYYDVAMVTYPSQGGGSFLGGRGTYRHHIAEDFLPEEREVPQELLDECTEREKQIANRDFKPDEEWHKRGQKLHEEIKKCPPKQDIWKTIGEHGWRKRGWMEYAYPALGKGAILPTDWVGLGCTLLSKKALSLAHFDGYGGLGTQDLFLCWNCWNPRGLKMSVITHTLCDHIVRSRNPDAEDGSEQNFDKIVHVQAYHEPEGDYAGHLRQRHLPFYKHTAGEVHIPENDGIVQNPSVKTDEEKPPAKKPRRRRK